MDKIRNFEEKSFSKIIITPLPQPLPDLRECVTSMIFQELIFFCLAGLAGVSPIENLSLIFFCFQKNLIFLNIMATCDQQEKVCLVKRYYCDFFYK